MFFWGGFGVGLGGESGVECLGWGGGGGGGGCGLGPRSASLGYWVGRPLAACRPRRRVAAAGAHVGAAALGTCAACIGAVAGGGSAAAAPPRLL